MAYFTPPDFLAKSLFFIFCFLVITSGCKSLKDSPKYKFDDGVYISKLNGRKQQVYIENTNDTIAVYSLQKGWKKLSPNESTLPKRHVAPKSVDQTIRANKFWQNSFDLDFLTVPLKFRPSVNSFPRQFSNNLNGTVYIGYRNDTYRLYYKRNPIGKMIQKTTHYGISAGIITGLGATAMNPYVTNNNISIEYDGLVWSKGVAVLIGFETFTFGIIGSLDHLMDSNKSFWIYQSKPYLGLAVGLNIN